ncbi:MAG: 30S ribosomal protein S5 [Phycisphaerales bacterium]|nr:30S ribosomal protein S5 [Phycisphaerales bacterium]
MARRVTEDSDGMESTTVGIFRTAATIKGGRRFSFGAMVVVGDRNGTVGYGYGKANEVPASIEKAQKEGRKSVNTIPLKGRTIPHTVQGRFGASVVKLIPASPGTGVVAGSAVRAVLELAGIHDCLTKALGSTNKKNLVKATLNGLSQLRTRETIAELRGVEIQRTRVDEMLERGAAYMPATKPQPGEEAPAEAEKSEQPPEPVDDDAKSAEPKGEQPAKADEPATEQARDETKKD